MIIVSATPARAQIAAGLRVSIIVAGSLAALAGHAKLFDSDTVNMLSAMVGPATSVVAFIFSQLATRSTAKKLAITAEAAPDEVAQIRH